MVRRNLKANKNKVGRELLVKKIGASHSCLIHVVHVICKIFRKDHIIIIKKILVKCLK